MILNCSAWTQPPYSNVEQKFEKFQAKYNIVLLTLQWNLKHVRPQGITATRSILPKRTDRERKQEIMEQKQRWRHYWRQ